MATDQRYPPEHIHAIRALVSRSRQHAEELRAQAGEAERIKSIWERLFSYVEQDWPLHIVDLMERESALLKELRARNDTMVPALEEIFQIAKSRTQGLHYLLPKQMEEASKAHDLPLDLESRHPRYSFDGGFFRVEIDDAKRIAKLSDNEGELARFPADIGAIVSRLLQERKRVLGRAFNGHAFLQKLRHHYLAVLKKEGQPDGTSVPIRLITRRLGKNEKAFRTDEFLVDLSRLVVEGPLEIDGRRLDLQQTRDTNQGMLLFGQAGRGYVGFIMFRKD